MAYLDNLISFWPLDEASGDAIDAHGSHDLTDTNTVGAGTGLVGATARDFENGSTEYFTAASHADFQMGDIGFTLQAWVKFESKDSWRFVVSKWTTSGDNKEYILLYNPGFDRFSFHVTPQGWQETVVSANNLGAPANGTWYLIHAWHDPVANEIGISVNGGTADTAAHTTGVYAGGTAPFQIGYGDSFAPFDGLIEQVGLWKRVLTSGERTALYNSGAGFAYPFGEGGPAPITSSGGVVIGAPSLSGTATYTPAPITSSGGVAIGKPALSGTATYTPAPITSSGGVVIGPPALSGSGPVADITSSGGVVIGAPVLSGTATYTPPSITSSGGVVIGAPSLRGTDGTATGGGGRSGGRFLLGGRLGLGGRGRAGGGFTPPFGFNGQYDFDDEMQSGTFVAGF